MTTPIKKIGRYEIQRTIGRGGMAMVYLALDPSMKREVAIKVLSSHLTIDPEFRVRFRREAEVIAQLEHDAIVPIYDFGEHDEQPYIVMRYLSGGSLLNRQAEGPLALSEVAEIVNRVARALDAAHKRNIIHRDIKPGNILFDADQQVFLSDFGIAKIAEASAAYTASGIIGTPAYMSPEQANSAHIDSRSDIYSLGVVAFQALTGEPPYRSDTPIGLAMKHITAPIPAVADIRPDLPADCQIVIDQALAKDPNERYAIATEFAFDLSAIAKGEGISPRAKQVGTNLAVGDASQDDKEGFVNTMSLSTKAPSWQSRWPIIAALAFLIVVLFIAFNYLGEPSPPNTPTSAQAALALTKTPSPETPTVIPTTPVPPTDTPTPVTPTRIPAMMAGTIKNDEVVVYNDPNTDSSQISALTKDTSVAVLNRNAQGDWLRIHSVNGVEGWVERKNLEVLMPILDILVYVSPTPSPTATATPTNTATLTATRTNTPQQRIGTATPTRRATTAPARLAGSLFEAPTVSQPPNEASFNDFETPRLSWNGVKTTLAEDELYLITIDYRHGEDIWTDYGWTQETTWLLDHRYLLNTSSDGRFVWSVKLLQKTGVKEQNVPIGNDLSESSQERVFYWRVFTPDNTKSSPVR